MNVFSALIGQFRGLSEKLAFAKSESMLVEINLFSKIDLDIFNSRFQEIEAENTTVDWTKFVGPQFGPQNLNPFVVSVLEKAALVFSCLSNHEEFHFQIKSQLVRICLNLIKKHQESTEKCYKTLCEKPLQILESLAKPRSFNPRLTWKRLAFKVSPSKGILK